MRKLFTIVAPHLEIEKGKVIDAEFSDMSEDNIAMTTAEDGVSRYDESNDLCISFSNKDGFLWIGRNDTENVTITKDNIHLYYEFMSDEDLEKYRTILEEVFHKRAFHIASIVELPDNSIDYNCKEHIVLKTKDTLKPIDEYIEEIKASEEYRASLAEKA